MCVAVPMKVVKKKGDMGEVEMGGVRREVGLMLLDDVEIGDWVIIHAGIAISKINERDAQETITLLKQGGLL